MSILGQESESISLVQLEQKQWELGQIPISGVEPDIENFLPLLEEPIDSPLVTSVDTVPREEETANPSRDVITGTTEGEANIPLIEHRKATTKDPGNNAKNALDLGKVGDNPVTYNDDIGIKSGKTTDKNDYYKFTLTGKENDVSIILDGLKDNANLELLDTNGKSFLDNSTEKGNNRETIDAELGKGTYYARVYPQGNAKTKYGLRISAEEILPDPDSKPSGANNLGPLSKNKKTLKDEIGFKKAGLRDNSDFYEFTLTEKFNNLNIVLDGLQENANITLFDENENIIDQSQTKGNSKEIINRVEEAGTYYLQVKRQGTAQTEYQLSFKSEEVKGDPDGTLVRAQEIEIGDKPEKVQGEIGFKVGGKRDTKDFYQFTLEEDSKVTLNLDGLNQNVDLELLDNKGSLRYSSSNQGTEKEKIQAILEEGKYYGLVKPVGSDSSEYTLSLDANSKIKDKDAQLPGNDLGKFKGKRFEKSIPDSIGFNNGFVDTNDFYRFELTKETDLAITLDGLEQNADLELYGEDGTTLIFASKEKDTTTEKISTILDKGIYYINVESNSGSKTDYELLLTGNTEIAEPDDALPGTPLGELAGKKEGIAIEGEIGIKSSSNVRDFADFYNFSVAEKSRVNITLDNLSANARLTLLSNNEGEIDESSNKGNTDKAIAIEANLQPGNYYIGVEPEGNTNTPYELEVTANLQKDDIGSRKDAKKLGILNEQDLVTEEGSIGLTQGGNKDTKDYYSFELTETSDIILTLDDLDDNADLLLEDAKGKELDYSDAKGSKAESIKKKLPAGTYYAAIFPGVSRTKTDYELTLKATQKTVDLSSFKFNALDVEDGLKAGEKVKVNYQVSNLGNTKADTFNVGFYLSKDEGIDSGDLLLDTVEIKSLSGGRNTQKLTKQLTLPDSGNNFWQGSGDYYLGTIVDSDNTIAETSELNNSSSQKVGFEVSNDLIARDFNVTEATVNPGQKFNASVKVKNTGDKVEDFRVGYYLSSDNKIDTNDTLIDSQEILSLGRNETTTISKELTLPENGINGIKRYFVGAIVDDQNFLSEDNETNNISQEKVSLSPVPEDNAGNDFEKARNVGIVNEAVQEFSDWVGNFYGVSEDTHDYYQIEIDGRSNLNLTLDGLSANANLYLYDDEGGSLEQSVNKENKKEEISRKLLPGTYYALVQQNDGGNTNYNLEMSASPIEYPVPQIAGWNQDTALDIGAVAATPIKKTEYVGNLHGFTDDQNDFYKFEVEGDSTVQIDLTGLNANADLYLYNSESTGSIASSETLQKVDERIIKNLEPGTYFIEVQSVKNAKTTYDLQVVGTPLPNNGAGADPDSALDLETLVATPKTVNDWVGNIDDIDYYKFAVSENSTVKIDLTGMSDDANLELLNNKEKSLASSSQTENKDDVIITNLAPGDYFLEVDNYFSVGTPYNLQLSATSRAVDLAGNDFDEALNLGTLGTINQTEWVGSFDKNDYYKFTIAGDSAVKLGLTGMNGNANITLYDNEQDWITGSSNSGNADELIYRNLEPGDYYIKVNVSGSGADYNLTASATAIPDAGGETKETAGDMGDISAATQTLSNWVGDVDRRDWYKFTITGDSAVNLGLTGMADNGNLYLYDETDDYPIASSTNSNAENEEIVINLNPGTYYAQVYSYYDSTNTNYSLSATATAIPDAGGETKEVAGDMGDISATKTFSNWIGNVDQSDWFKFTIAGDSTVNLGLTGMTSNGDLYLYNETKENSIASSTKSNDADEAIVKNLTAGTYFAQVYRSSGNTNYNFTALTTALPDSTGSSFETARNLGIVSAAQTISDWVGDLQYDDYYKFSVSPNSSINLKLSGFTVNTGLYLYDSNEKQIASSDNDSNADESIIYNLAGGETYYVLVDGRSPYYDGGDTYYNLDLSATPLLYSPANLVGNTEARTKDIGALGGTQTFADFVGNQYLDRDKYDYYQFTLTETSTVNLNLGGMTANADLALLDSEYYEITDSSQLTNVDEAIIRNLVAGTYIVQVKSIENANTGYNLQLSATPHPDAAGETFATARQIGTLAAPQTFNDWIGNVDESDYYQFAIDAASTVNINLGGMTGNGNIRLYDVNADTLASSSNSDNVDDVIVADLNPGTYLVKVENGSWNFGTNYSLQLSPTVRLDTAGGADNPLDLGALTNYNTAEWVSPEVDSEDYYKFSIAENSAVNLSLSGLTDAINFRLYDSNMEEIVYASNDSDAETAIAENLTPGDYFVEVSNFYGNGTEYNFTASATALPDNAGNTTDVARQVGVLSGLQTFYDWVGNIDASDYYEFTLDTKRTVNINISDLSDDTSLYLYNSSGNTFYYDANDDYQGWSYIRPINSGDTGSMSWVLNPGTYFVGVFDYSSWSGLGTNYTLNLSAS